MPEKTSTTATCTACEAACCRYVATQIDEPDTKNDYDNIRWYLLHRDVSVFVDHDDDWYIEFTTPCEALDDQHLCTIYGQRPRLCRTHGSNNENDCEHLGAVSPYKLLFKTATEFENYLDKRKIKWRKKS